MANERKPVRMVAGAPVKNAPVPVKVVPLLQGVWVEKLSDGSEIIVTDMTSALWRYKGE